MSGTPDMLTHLGGVPVGVDRLASMFQAGNIWFVDGTDGQTRFEGKTPSDAKALPSAAVTAASREGIIYIRPMTTVACADVYYSDNITIPITKPQLQLIGCGAGGGIPGYRGSAQLRAATTTSSLITIESSGVVVENLHLNGTSMTAGNLIKAVRSATVQAVCAKVRNNRFITGGAELTAVWFGSCQYSWLEDNLFLDCYRGFHLEATSGSPQSIVCQRNIFSGMVLQRDVDIYVTATDIQSKGHLIHENIFADGQPNHATARYQTFIDFSNTSGVSTGIVSRNCFATTDDNSLGTSGGVAKLPAGWFAVANYYEGTSAAGLAGHLTRA
jgi:hypothetical protein